MTALTSPGFRSVGFRDIGSPAGAPQPVAGAIAWYRCDEGSGQRLTDYSGNGNHGTLGSTAGVDTNDPVWNEKGLYFGGDDMVTIGDLSRFGLPYSLDLIFYIPTAISAASPPQALFYTRPSPDTNNFYVVEFGSFTSAAPNEIIGISSRLNSNPTTVTVHCSDTQSIPAGWHDFTMNWNPPKNAYDLYLDCVILGSVAAGAENAPILPITDLHLGGRQVGGAFEHYFVGGMGGLSIYPFSRSQNQIVQQYTYEKYRLAPKQVFLP